MASEINTLSFSDFVRLAKMLWFKGANSTKSAMMESGFVKTIDIPQNTGNTREWSEIDDNEYLTRKGQDDTAARARVQQGYKKVMTSYRVAENLGISYEMRTQNKYPEIVSKLTAGGRKGTNTIDLDLSHRFTFGTATTYTDRDGILIDIATGDTKALFYSAHTLTGSTKTFRNRLANNPRISKGAIEGMERLVVEQTYSHLGELKTSMDFGILWTTADPNSVNTTREYLQSKADVEGAHSGITNVLQGTYRHVILPRIATTAAGQADTSKRYYWGIASAISSSFYLGIWERPHMIPPSAGNSDGEDVQTDSQDFRNRAGYGMCVVGALWVKFSSGTGES